jgi:cation transport regulator ChaC
MQMRCSRRSLTAASICRLGTSCRGVVFKIGAERFSRDLSFTRTRRSMSLTEVRRLDQLKGKIGR